MSDERVRALGRAAATGDDETRAQLVREALRAGNLELAGKHATEAELDELLEEGGIPPVARHLEPEERE